ncbi:MAG: insulinase family protein, partial [Bacteroidetes bacterium]
LDEALAKKHYGALKNTATPEQRARTPEPTPIASRRVTLVDKRVASPYVIRNYLGPSYKTADKGQAEALDILAQILDGGTSGRMYRQLVVKENLI